MANARLIEQHLPRLWKAGNSNQTGETRRRQRRARHGMEAKC